MSDVKFVVSVPQHTGNDRDVLDLRTAHKEVDVTKVHTATGVNGVDNKPIYEGQIINIESRGE